MKKIHTQSKAANRCSAWHKGPSFRGQSAMRRSKRQWQQPKTFRTFGQQVRTQAIKIREKFRTYVRTIFHAKTDR